MTYIDALTSIVESFGCTVDGSAVLVPGENKPVKIKIDTLNGKIEKDLVLPTKDRLKDNDWEEVVAFHPACENVTAGQSEIIKFLIRYVKSSMIERSLLLIGELLKLEASKDKKKSTYAKYLSKFPDVNATTIKSFEIFKKGLAEKGTTDTLVKIFIDRKDYIEGEQFMRVLTFDSPIFQDDSDDAVLLGVKLLTKTAKKAICALFTDLYFGGITQRGSNADTPYLDVLLRFWIEFAKKYNSIVKMIQKDSPLELIDVSFEEALDDMVSFRKRVPALPGNTGDSIHRNKVVEDDKPPFDVEEERRRSQPTREDLEQESRDEWRNRPQYEEPAATGLNFFRGNGRRDDRRDEQPSSTGNPLDHRYSGGRGRYSRDRDRDDRYETYSDRRDRDRRDRDRDDRDDRRGGRYGGYGDRFGLGRSREDEDRAKKFGRR
jgi:hypothetical protein